MLSIDGFEAPLDWLLDLARTLRIDLAKLSIVAVVEAFAEALSAALAAVERKPTALARWSDWLVMAAELTLLRSRLLAPADAMEARDAEAAAERLRRMALDRTAVGTIVDWLEARDQLGRDVFGRGVVEAERTQRAGRTGDVTALLRACLAVIRVPEGDEGRFRVPAAPFWTVADAARRIREVLAREGGERQLGSFLPEIPDGMLDRTLQCRVAVAATFLAGLELARDGTVALQQEPAWMPIRIIITANR